MPNMNKCYLDSNLLVYFFNDQSAYHRQAVQVLEQLLADNVQLCISGLVLDEALFILSKTAEMSDKVFDHKERLQLFKSLKQITSLSMVNIDNKLSKHRQVSSIMAEYNLQPRDAYHLLHCWENDITVFASFDEDFSQWGETAVKELD
jgi:predicted nucleic acid-binding protein